MCTYTQYTYTHKRTESSVRFVCAFDGVVAACSSRLLVVACPAAINHAASSRRPWVQRARLPR